MAVTYFFLDTQIFDANAYDFENKHFKVLMGLADLDMVCLVLPEVSRREIESHIAEKSKEAFISLDKFRRNGFHKNLRVPPFDAIAKGTTEDAIRAELRLHFQEFCKRANAINLPMKGIDLASVIDDYFDRKAPFGEGKKKSEFPDAISAKLLVEWCKKKSKKVVVVSKDSVKCAPEVRPAG